MKLHGIKLEPRRVTIVLPPDRVFIVKAVLSDEKFTHMCNEPKPPMLTPKDSDTAVPMYTDKKYLAAMEKFAKQRTMWMMIESLSDTPGLEWELVKPEDPATWDQFYEELKNSGLSMFEQGKLINAIMEVNIVTDAAIAEATKAFLATKSAPAK